MDSPVLDPSFIPEPELTAVGRSGEFRPRRNRQARLEHPRSFSGKGKLELIKAERGQGQVFTNYEKLSNY